MDRALLCLPEIDPNDSGNHTQSEAPVSLQVSLQNAQQQLSAERSALKEKLHIHKTAEMPRNEVNALEKNDEALVGSIQTHAQACPISLSFLPAVCPPPLHLQALSPGAIPEFLCPPCSHPPSYWLPMNPSSQWPSSTFGFSPYMLHPFSSPPEFWGGPWLFPPILCPQMVPVHQTCAADQALGSTQKNIIPASERREKQAWSGGQRSMNHVKEDQQNKLQEGNTGNEDNPDNKIKVTDSPGPSPFLDEEPMEEDAFEECMKLMDSFFAQLFPARETGEEECGEPGTLKLENGSFVEYLGELCSDEDFVNKVESTLNIETLMSPLSSDQDLLDVFAQQEQEQEMQEELPPLPANSNPLPEETTPVTLSYKHTSQLLILDPPGIQAAASPKQKGQNSPKTEDWICCSPLLPSHLLEEPPLAEGPVKDPFTPPEESQTPLDACFTDSHRDIFMSMMHLFPDTSEVADLESDDALDTIFSFLNLIELRIQTTPPPVESPSISRLGPSLSADLLTESLQESTCQLPHPQPPAPIGKPEEQLSSWFDAARDLSFAVHSDPDSFNLPVKSTLSDLESEKQTEEPADPRSGAQGEMEGKHVEMRGPQTQRVMKGGEKKVGRRTLEKKEQVRKENEIKVKPSILIRCDQRLLDESEKQQDGERKTSEENGTKTAKLIPKRNEAAEQKRQEKEGHKWSQKTEAEKQGEPSNPTFCSETAVNKTLFSTPKTVQPTPTAGRKTKCSQENREQIGKSSPEGEMEGIKLQAKEFVLQNVPIISLVKRSMRGEEGKAGAGKIGEKTVSACPTKEGKAPLHEGREPERPSSCSANTSVTNSGSNPTLSRKSKNVFEGTIWSMRPQVQTSTTSSPKPSPGAGTQDDEEPRGARPSLTGSPVKRLGEKWEATGEMGFSADNTRMENEQLGPSPAKKSTKRKHKGSKKPKSNKEQRLRRK